MCCTTFTIWICFEKFIEEVYNTPEMKNRYKNGNLNLHFWTFEKYDKKNGNYKACINPDCDYLHTAESETDEKITSDTDE